MTNGTAPTSPGLLDGVNARLDAQGAALDGAIATIALLTERLSVANQRIDMLERMVVALQQRTRRPGEKLGRKRT